MILHQPRTRPEPWSQWKQRVRMRWLDPLLALEYVWEWIAFLLSNWSFLEVLEYLGSFSVLVAVIFYYSETGDRIKQKHYQAWQVINTAQGKGGSGGRIEALQELNKDGVPLVGVDLSSAFLQGVRLEKADLHRANLNAADLRGAVLRGSNLEFADLRSANLRGADLYALDLANAYLTDADLVDANLRNADLTSAKLDSADLTGAKLEGVKTSAETSFKGAVGVPAQMVKR